MTGICQSIGNENPRLHAGWLRESLGNYDDYLRNAEQWAQLAQPSTEKAPKAAVVTQSKQQRESSIQLRRLKARFVNVKRNL